MECLLYTLLITRPHHLALLDAEAVVDFLILFYLANIAYLAPRLRYVEFLSAAHISALVEYVIFLR